MEVIFIKDVKDQGLKGEIKEVKDGYARNYLFKNDYAVAVTKVSLNRLKKEKKTKKEIENKKTDYFKQLKEKIESERLIFKVKSGVKDKLFGSISSKQISAKLKLLGYDIDRKKIILPETLSSLGSYQIKILLHKKIIANLKIELIKE